MIKVACITCQAPYDLDERRLPPTGLRMKCPKCAASFKVFPDGRTEAVVHRPTAMFAGGAPDAPAAPAPAAPAAAPAAAAAAAFGAPAKPVVPAAPEPAAFDLDLAPAKPAGAPAADDLDLPAPKGAKARPATMMLDESSLEDLDLPAPKAPPAPRAPMPPPRGAAAKPAAPPAPKPAAPPAPARGGAPDLDDLDLPAPKAAAKAPIALGAPVAPAAPPQSALAEAGRTPFDDLDGDLDLPAAKAAPRAVDSLLDLPAPKHLRAPAAAAAPSGLDLDLPAPKAAAKGPSLDLDLPAPKRGGGGGLDLDLPTPKAAAKGPSLDLDLPTPKRGGEVDLPAPKGGGLDLDLPTPKRGGGGGGLDLDLPTPKAGGGLDLDLPTPRRAGGGGLDLDLPTPKGATDLPAVKSGPSFGDLDLPTPRRGGELADLPTPRGVTDLPQTAGATDLPTLRKGSSVDLPQPGGGGLEFDDLALPDPRGASSKASSGGLELDDLSLPPAKKRQRPPTAELELPLPGDEVEKPFGDVELPDTKQGVEFADVGKSMPAPAEPGRIAKGPRQALPRVPAKMSKAVPVVLGGLLVLGLAGGALTFTSFGPFGYYAIEQVLPGAGDPAVVRSTIEAADRLALADTPSDSMEALMQLGRARRDAGVNRDLLARSLLHESLYQVRFGNHDGTTRAAAIRQRIEARGGTDEPRFTLALAADQLRLGNPEAATSRLGAARRAAPNDAFVDLVAGEAALAGGHFAEAHEAFQAAVAHGGGAAAQWGIARALAGGDNDDAIAAAIEATLAASPRHIDARLAKAERAIRAGHTDEALPLVRQVAGEEQVDGAFLSVPAEQHGRALVLLGRLNEARGRYHAALDAFEAAIQLDSQNVEALLGSGRMFLRETRATDALARFESVLQREDGNQETLPNGRTIEQETRLGAAQAMLEIERAQEARAILEALAQARPDDADVHLWFGRAEDRLGAVDGAERELREAIRLAPHDHEAYLALVRLYVRADRRTDADAFLERAIAEVTPTTRFWSELGDLELGRSRLNEATRAYRRALELDPAQPSARFGLGVSLRRAGQLDAATAAFEELARTEPNHPGLALERGLLFEARGDAARAVTFYRNALAESPESPQLQLRLAAAQVAAGQLDEAATALESVQRALPASPDAEHFIGRIAFARGNYADALSHFDRAIGLDSSHGEYFLYAAWAAMESGQLGRARERAEQALERDATLGDAYWIRGVVRLRSGAVRDAQSDFTRALELKPTRYEALAGLAECHDQLRNIRDAIATYERAVAAVDTRGKWWYDLGRLQLDNSAPRDAIRALGRATLLGDAETPRPGWAADAHRLYGEALRMTGDRGGAVQHYRRYLELAPPSAIDRAEVRSTLMDMGEVPPQ